MEGVIGERFACVDCGLFCGSEDDIRRHLELECGTRPRVECPECPFRTTWEEALESHWLRKHGDQGPAFICTGCGDGFSSSVDISAHLRLYCSRLRQRTFPCSKCDRVFTSKAGLTRHSNKCSGQFKCLSCPFRSATKQNLRSHICSRHGPEVLAIYNHVMAHNIDFTCSDCDRRFDTKPQLEVHLWERCAKEAKFECPVCFKRLYGSYSRRSHMVKTHGEDSLRKIRLAKNIGTPFRCNKCDRSFKSKAAFTEHVAICGQPPTQQCLECSYTTYLKLTLIAHVKKQHGLDAFQRMQLQKTQRMRAGKAFPCPQCMRAFSAKIRLSKHLRYDCGKPRKCPECPAVLNSQSTLRAHVLRKHGESALAKIMPPVEGTPYRCNKCDRSFKSRAAFTEHVAICGQPPTQQCLECPYITHLELTLIAHVKEQHGVDAFQRMQLQKIQKRRAGKAFPCPHCERGFSAKPCLSRHLRHDCGKPSKCPECPAVLNTRSNLIVHIRKKHGESALAKIALPVEVSDKRYKCVFCGRGYNYRGNLRVHLKKCK